MCGIVGFVSKEKKPFFAKHLDLFEELLICDSIRGNDSTGAFTVLANNQVKALKVATNPHYLMETKHWEKFREVAVRSGHVLVGHNRSATYGAISRENAHPFAEKNIILIHNGTVSNHKKMADVEVDSHAICHEIAEKGYEEALPGLVGAFALVWYDITSRKLYFSRNDDRPLLFVENKEFFAFASEGYMLAWILRRNGITFDKIEPLPPGIVLSLSWSPFKVEIQKLVKKNQIVNLPQVREPSNFNGPQGMKAWEYYSDCYKKDTPVIFVPDNYIEDANHLGKFRLTGMAYLPGKPMIHQAICPLDKDYDEADVMDLSTENKLIANIRNLVLTADDQIVVYLNNVKTDLNIDLWNDIQIPETEWKYFIENFKCSKCDATILEKDNQLTSIVREPAGHKIVCIDCVCANYHEMPEEFQEKILQQGRTIDAVK